jgi:hypothetical protein
MYKVIDNIIPRSYQEQLKMLFDDGRMTWQYREVSAGVEGDVDPADTNIKESPMFNHEIYAYDTGIQSQVFEQIKPILFFAEEKLDMTVKGLGRIKANLQIKDETALGKYHPPHVDTGHHEEGFILLYYLKDSDGPTIIFDKRSSDPGGHIGLKEIGRVEPKQGRAVLLQSNRYHASSSPVTSENRLVLNMVFFSENFNLTKNS